MKNFSLALLAFLACVVFAPKAALADALQGVAPLKDSELGQLCGGFSLPNGLNVNVGIDNQISLNGIVIANSTFSFNGTTVTSSGAGTTQVQSGTGTTTVQMSPTSAIITNTASNVGISQMRSVSVNISGLTKMGMQGLGNVSTLQLQALTAFKNGLH